MKKLYVEAQSKADIVAGALAKKILGHLSGARWTGGQSRRRGSASDWPARRLALAKAAISTCRSATWRTSDIPLY
jgi:hypothetical protein